MNKSYHKDLQKAIEHNDKDAYKQAVIDILDDPDYEDEWPIVVEQDGLITPDDDTTTIGRLMRAILLVNQGEEQDD